MENVDHCFSCHIQTEREALKKRIDEIAIRDIMNTATYFDEENEEEDSYFDEENEEEDAVVIDWPKNVETPRILLATIEEEEEDEVPEKVWREYGRALFEIQQEEAKKEDGRAYQNTWNGFFNV